MLAFRVYYWQKQVVVFGGLGLELLCSISVSSWDWLSTDSFQLL
jgi:hypothetical protein